MALAADDLARTRSLIVNFEVGEKVTVTYTMSATDVEVKASKGAKKEAASPPGSPKKK